MTTQWYYAQNGKQSGPVSTEQLSEKLAGGSLAPSDLVWSEGMASWTPAGEVPSLTPPQGSSPPTLLRPYIPPPPPGPSPALAPLPRAAPPPPGFAPPRAAQGRAFAPAPVAAQPWDDTPLRPPGVAQGSGGEVAAEIVTILAKTKPWVRFLSVLGFLGVGTIVLASIVILVVPMESIGSSSLGPRIAASVIYLVSALLQLPAVLFLHRYASQISGLTASKDQADLEKALSTQGSFWRYVGILTLVSAILGGLALIGGLVLLGASLAAR